MSPQFEKIKQHVLGKTYDLSVAFLSPAEMRKVDKKHPHPTNPNTLTETPTKASGNKPSNVLAFPLSKTSGEILICKDTAYAQAHLYKMGKRNFVTYIFIHGLLHLQGMDHSATMENEERRIMKKFGFGAHE